MIYDFSDVVVVPFPFVDRAASKRRPAVVLSNSSFNRLNGQSVCVMITTGAGSSWPSDIAITDGEAAGITHASLIRWKVFTLPNDFIQRKAGRLGSQDLEAFVEACAQQLNPVPLHGSGGR